MDRGEPQIPGLGEPIPRYWQHDKDRPVDTWCQLYRFLQLECLRQGRHYHLGNTKTDYPTTGSTAPSMNLGAVRAGLAFPGIPIARSG